MSNESKQITIGVIGALVVTETMERWPKFGLGKETKKEQAVYL